MYKKSTSVFKIVAKSFSTYLKNIQEFLKYILYPIFGQFAGVFVCFLPFFMTGGNQSNINIPLVLLCMIAGLIIFCHAFWKYLLVSGGLVLISRQIVENEPVQEFSRYTEIFSKRSKDYIKYLFIMILISLLFVAAAVVWMFAMIAKYYNVQSIDMTSLAGQLLFQALPLVLAIFLISSVLFVCLESFALNPNATPFGGILKGIKLSVRNFFPNLGLMLILILISVVFSEFTGLILKNAVFNEALYAKYGAFSDMVSLLEVTAQGCIVSILVPFITLCRTWWYLRMDKEHAARAQKRG